MFKCVTEVEFQIVYHKKVDLQPNIIKASNFK